MLSNKLTVESLNNISNHVHVNQSLIQLEHEIARTDTSAPIASVITNDLSLAKIIESNIVQLVINDMIYIKTNKTQDPNIIYILRLKHSTSFLKSLRRLSSVLIITYEQLRLLFDLFVIDPSSDDEERFAILSLLFCVYTHRGWTPTLKQFYLKYFEPTMVESTLNQNYSLLSKLYFAFSEYSNYFGHFDDSIQSNVFQYIEALDTMKMAKYIISELNNTKNETKYTQMIYVLKDIVNNERPPTCIDLLSNENKMTEDSKRIFKDIFDTFATNMDGSMSSNDFRRYILACGAGKNSASPSRIAHVFGGADQLSFESFCAFYETALRDRPQHVWNDLYVFGYNNALQIADHVQNDESVYQYLKQSDAYHDVLDQYFVMHIEWGKNAWKTWGYLQYLPQSEKMTQRMIDFENIGELVNVVDNGDDDSNSNSSSSSSSSRSLHQLLYTLLQLNSICVSVKDDEWKQQFVRSKAFDHLIKMVLKYCLIAEDDACVYDCEYVYHLGIAMLLKIMYRICSFDLSYNVSLNMFMHYGYNIFDVEKENELEILLSARQNYLIHLMVMDGKLGNEKNIGLLNVIPYQITRIYSQVLICGYVKKCQLSSNIPQDLLKTICFFF